MEFSDPGWTSMLGGYRVPYDPRGALLALEQGDNFAGAWEELWNELHHQGDVGEASYAAVPHLVRIHAARGAADWNTYALIATIDDARRDARNPELPPNLRQAYEDALRALADIGLKELRTEEDPMLISNIIAVLAIWKQQYALGRIATLFDEEERKDFLIKAGWS
jgi:hypothetical protein